MVYELNNQPCNPTNNFTLKNCLFGTAKLTKSRYIYKNAGKFTYNGRGIAFDDGKGYWSFDNDYARIAVTFIFDNSSSPHIDNLKNNFLVLGEGSIEAINGSVGATEKKIILTLVNQIQNFALQW